MADEIDILCDSPVDGLYSNGTAGEFHGQTDAEFDRITVIVAEGARRAGKPFQIGVSHSNARIARERLARLAPTGAAAAQFTLPDWWPPTLSEAERFIEGMQEAAGELPLVLYNPPHAKKRLSLPEIARMRERAPGLIGAKLPGGDGEWYAQRRRLLPEFSVFVPGHTVATARPLGGDGSYSNMACLSPAGAVAWWRLIETDRSAAIDLERRIQRFLAEHILPYRKSLGLSDAALDKLMAAAGGWGPVSPRLLWPYSSAPDEAVAAVAAAARSLIPEFGQSAM